MSSILEADVDDGRRGDGDGNTVCSPLRSGERSRIHLKRPLIFEGLSNKSRLASKSKKEDKEKAPSLPTVTVYTPRSSLCNRFMLFGLSYGGYRVTHFAYSKLNTFLNPALCFTIRRQHFSSRSSQLRSIKPSKRHDPFPIRMTSSVEQQHEWNAVRVRKTFLEYFEKNGHTFGNILVKGGIVLKTELTCMI